MGATSHYVAVPADRAEQPVREFEAFTADLYRLADWLTQCGVETVVMESTGVYWIPLFGVLEERGFQVMLVDPRRIKNVPGRKTDVLDCQWLQQLHTYGLLSGLSDPTGRSGAYAATCGSGSCWCSTHPTISAYAEGADPDEREAPPRHQRYHRQDRPGHHRSHRGRPTGPATTGAIARSQDQSDEATIAKSLQGHWREEHIFELNQAWSCTGSIRIRLPSATGRSKPSWSGLRTAAMVILQRRSPAGGAAKETRHASTFGRTCTV